MPTYEYHCKNCQTIEVSQKITEPPLRICPFCGSKELRRGPGGGIGVSFKGSGFYATDYAREQTPQEGSKGECCPCGKNQKSCETKEK